MGVIGSTVGGALKLGGHIFGGIKASKAIRNAKRNIRNQLNENQNWYDRNYNADSTQRADARRILEEQRDFIRKRNKAAAGAQAVMGGGDEAVAAAREANNRSLADATSQIAVAGEARKDNVEQQYMAKKDALNNQLNALEHQKAANIAKAVGGVSDAAGALAGAIPDRAKLVTQPITVGPQQGLRRGVVGELLAEASRREKEYLDNL